MLLTDLYQSYYDTNSLQQHDVQNSHAKKTDYRSSLRGLQRPLGGLAPAPPPKPKPSYVPAEMISGI